MEAQKTSQSSEYHVVSVVEKERPANIDGISWYHYVISNNRSTINGQRQGTREQVVEHANDFADQLNNRDLFKIRVPYRPIWK